MLEVKGKDKTDLLVAKLNEADVRTIRRPIQTERLLLLDLDLAVTEEEVERDLQKAVPEAKSYRFHLGKDLIDKEK